ncbi:tetratricopeptide repeat protein [Thermoactinospora rubra]|uniref:tetratricopeptide repeat protein n=1 Tax=Thermoactinospora rubra TaxID=1088767 RepID=UPI000A1014EB|nr:tetratricopeptide repeat protein [Thermoactinospora rubra]
MTPGLAVLDEQRAEVLDLAMALSVATSIEPELIRAMRLIVVPAADAAAEADLWWGDMVAARRPDAIVLAPELLPELRRRLAARLREAPPTHPLHGIWQVIERVHAGIPPALFLEEYATWLAVSGGEAGVQQADLLLRQALRALVEEGRTGVSDWFAGAWERLPEELRTRRTSWQLAQLSPDLLPEAGPALAANMPHLTVEDAAVVVEPLPDVALGVRLTGAELELGGQAEQAVLVPDTRPRLLEVLVQGRQPRLVAVPEGETVRVRAGRGPVRLRTARGVVYELGTAEPVLLRRVAEDRRPSHDRVVRIYGTTWLGTGYRVGTNVLTVAHAVMGREPLSVETGGTRAAARVLWRDVRADVAVLEVFGAEAAPRAVRWGEWWGLRDAYPAQVWEGTSGVLNATVGGEGELRLEVPSVYPGMSGAPVFAGDLLVGLVRSATEVVPLREVTQTKLFRSAFGRAPLASVDLWELFGRTELSVLPATPAGLLDPHAAVVGFTGREWDLSLLTDWCENPDDFAVRLLVAPAGEGKTRLGAELVARMREAGWEAGFLADAPPEEALTALAERRRPVLLVVDHAETQAERVAGLRALARPDRPPLRLLLLARSAGEWIAGPESIEIHHLQPLYPDHAARAGAWPAVVRQLGWAVSTLPGYDTAEGWDRFVSTTAAAVPDLADDAFANALVLQMAALVALTEPFPHDPADVDPALDSLLAIEEGYWLQAASRFGLPLDAAACRTWAASAALWGARNQEEAGAVVDDPSVVEWLAHLFPQEGRLWGRPRPDQLATLLVVSELGRNADTILSPLDRVSPWQLHHAVTVLARAAGSHPAAEPYLRRVVERSPSAGVRVALEIENPASLVTCLFQLIESAELDELRRLRAALPTQTTLLAEFAAQSTWALAAALIDRDLAEERPELASVLNDLAIRLDKVGRTSDAASVATFALELYQELAATDPLGHEPGLGRALINAAARSQDLPERERAAEAAVALYRRLSASDPEAHLPELALALHNLAVCLSDAGRAAEALAAGQEVLVLLRRLAEQSDAYLPDLAMTLNNLVGYLSELDRDEESLIAAAEATRIYRELAAANPDAYTEHAAIALANHARVLADVGRVAEGAAAAAEAVRIMRSLVETGPEAHAPTLAAMLHLLAYTLTETGRFEEALSSQTEAVTLLRRTGGHRSAADLASSLRGLAVILLELGRGEEALEASQEAVAMARDGDDPVELAEALSGLGDCLGRLGRFEEAAEAAHLAASAYREPAKDDPERFLGPLIMCLASEGEYLSQAGHAGRAREADETAKTLYDNAPQNVRTQVRDVMDAIFARSPERIGEEARQLRLRGSLGYSNIIGDAWSQTPDDPS